MNNDINPLEEITDKEEEKRIFSEIAKIEGITEYFRALMARDMRLHFSAKKEEQDLVRGAYFRTEYLMKRIKDNGVDNKQ